MLLDYIALAVSFVALGISYRSYVQGRTWQSDLLNAAIKLAPKTSATVSLSPLQNTADATVLGGVQCAKCHLIVNRFQRLINGRYVCANCMRGNL